MKNFEYEGVKLYGSSHEDRFITIQQSIENFRPDIIFTQLMWSDVALDISKKNNIPSVLRICKIPFQMNISKGSKYSPTAALVVSEAVGNYIKSTYLREGTLIYPPVSLEKVKVSKKIDNFNPINSRFITLFNPLERKGAKIFKEITKALPEKEFAIVPGWTCLKDSSDSEKFSSDLIKKMCESLGIEFTGKIPEYVDFSDCPNVKKLEPSDEVWKIYKDTRILLVPSQWEEAFGRVAIEGMANGIPVIGSSIGGLKEAIGSSGIVVKDYKNPSEWIKEIKKLDQEDNYKEISNRELKNILENYSLKDQIKKYLNFFTEIMKTRDLDNQGDSKINK